MFLGELLTKMGYASREQVDFALSLQRRQGGRVGAILIAIGALTSQQLIEVLQIQRERNTAAAT